MNTHNGHTLYHMEPSAKRQKQDSLEDALRLAETKLEMISDLYDKWCRTLRRANIDVRLHCLYERRVVADAEVELLCAKHRLEILKQENSSHMLECEKEITHRQFAVEHARRRLALAENAQESKMKTDANSVIPILPTHDSEIKHSL